MRFRFLVPTLAAISVVFAVITQPGRSGSTTRRLGFPGPQTGNPT
jgi:hypothetical protein